MGQVELVEPRSILVVVGMQILAFGKYIGLVIQFQSILSDVVLDAGLETLGVDCLMVAAIRCVAAPHLTFIILSLVILYIHIIYYWVSSCWGSTKI